MSAVPSSGSFMHQNPRANQVLAALETQEWQRIQPHLELVHLMPQQALCVAGQPVRHVHFPTTALVSLVCSTAEGDTVEVAVVGSEGLVGFTFAARNEWTHGVVVVQGGGEALRLPLHMLQRELAGGGNLLALTLRHEELLKAQMAQTALCSKIHRIDEQVCRWIMTHVDRTGGDCVEATQQYVAGMLGVRREGVSSAMARLQVEGILSCGRGHLRVLDRRALEARCCECYAALRTTSRRVCGLTALRD
jgi:CRP-like cAMP-binding protein